VTDRRIAAAGAGRLRANILGPTLTAGFYRRAAIAALGGFETNLGDEWADVGMALALRALGQLHACQPSARLIQITTPRLIKAGGFRAGRACEQLFWRNPARRAALLAVALHGTAIVSDLVRRGLSISAAASLIGRAAAWLEFGASARHDRLLSAAAAQLAAVESSSRDILSVSAAREASARPRPQRKAA
jgi:hypothetical protein